MAKISVDSYFCESDYEYLPGLFSSLNDVLAENKNYYINICSGKKAEEFSQCFEELLAVTAKTLKLLLEVAAVSPLFDYDPNIKGNGYRSIVKVVEMCFRRLYALSKYFQENRDRLLFRSDHYYKEIVSYLELSKGLYTFLEFAQLLLRWSTGNDLFAPEDSCDAETMTVHLEEMEKECFYGRRLGFHFNTAIRSFLTTVGITMASFGDGYGKHDGYYTVAAASLLNGPKYLINPDLRASKLISLTTLVDMEFCKAFWSLTERYGLQHFPLVVSSALKTNIIFEIPPEPLTVSTKTGETITLQPPSAWIGFAPIEVHLLSYLLREGQIDSDGKMRGRSEAKPKADGLIIHIHGGGFVAQSSRSHEIYLRGWAKSINVPILSINYALAPELPFPRALEECLFAYVWALENFDKLGTTGKYIALVGDSAGGNLSTTLCLKAASHGIRLPDGILASYAPFKVQFRPSPSRLLCLLDPLLPVGILTQCLAAYTGADKERSAANQEEHMEKSASTTFSVDVPESYAKHENTDGKSCGVMPHKSSSPDARDHRINSSSCHDDSGVLPDLIESSRVALPMHHSSSEFDLAHVEGVDNVDMARSHSDTDLVKSSHEAAAVNGPVNLNSRGYLTDDHLMSVAKNPYLSPLAASDEQLAMLPPVDLLACSMDPLFDDSIEFAKRLRAVNNKVELYVIDDLPHGFLNFYMVSQEGREANELCIACIKKILQGKRSVVESESSPVY